MYKFIYSEEEINKFLTMLPRLEDDEAYFLSLSARIKYLNENEIIAGHYMGDIDFVQYDLIRENSIEKLLQALKRFEINEGYSSPNNKPIPNNCLVPYLNINPVSNRKALKEFNSRINQMLYDLKEKPDLIKRVAFLDEELVNCYYNSKSHDIFIDIDCDILNTDVDVVEEIISYFKKNNTKYFVIKTKSGFHILINRYTLKYGWESIVKEADNKLKRRNRNLEILINKRERIPIPGTLQAGYKVYILDI